MREAESHADEDKKRREEIETRNRADQAVYGAERFIKDTRRQAVGRPIKQAIEAAAESLKKAIEVERCRRDQPRDGGTDPGAAQGRRVAVPAGVRSRRGGPDAGR